MRKAIGISSLAAIIVEHAVKDFLFAPHDSAAYRSARKFIYGGECSHTICLDCMRGNSWRSGECPPGHYSVPCQCNHDWTRHLIMIFDWDEHRDVITGAAGVDPDALKGIACTNVSTARKTSKQKPTSPMSKSASHESLTREPPQKQVQDILTRFTDIPGLTAKRQT